MLQSLTATLDLLPTNSKLIRGIPEVQLKLILKLKLKLYVLCINIDFCYF